MKHAVRLRWGGLLSFGSSLLTDESNAKRWAEQMKGVAVPLGEPDPEPEPKKKKTTSTRR